MGVFTHGTQSRGSHSCSQPSEGPFLKLKSWRNFQARLAPTVLVFIVPDQAVIAQDVPGNRAYWQPTTSRAKPAINSNQRTCVQRGR